MPRSKLTGTKANRRASIRIAKKAAAEKEKPSFSPAKPPTPGAHAPHETQASTTGASKTPYAITAEAPGPEITGREILVRYTDGMWYDAIVVAYYQLVNEHKLVYRADDGIEVVDLKTRRWSLLPRKVHKQGRVYLDGAIVEFDYPEDGLRYKAMVYHHSPDGMRIKVAYLEEHSVDSLKGGGWDVILPSPCVEEDSDGEGSDELFETTMKTLRRAIPGS